MNGFAENGLNRRVSREARMIDRSADEQRKHEWGVILARGEGNRLKSLTRRITDDERPKQFCPVMGDVTLVEEARRRVALELGKERTLFLQIPSGRLP